MPLIGCVPNISEGRNKDVLNSFSEAISSVRGVRLLDVTSDHEQNRSVFTFVGNATPLSNAVQKMMHVAIEMLDITKHRGKHPRIGIVDVIPFVPLRDTTLECATKLARRVAREIGENFRLPVYLYADAAKNPERRSINRIREGEFEGLAEKITRPEWQPDFGPARVHSTAGAVAVGSRFPMVAVNLVLETGNYDTAEKIATALHRERFDPKLIKTLVINKSKTTGIKIAVGILNSKRIKLHEIVDAVKEEAEKHGTKFVGTELVGLVTFDALSACLEHYLKLIDFDELQILEHHIPWAKKR